MSDFSLKKIVPSSAAPEKVEPKKLQVLTYGTLEPDTDKFENTASNPVSTDKPLNCFDQFLKDFKTGKGNVVDRTLNAFGNLVLTIIEKVRLHPAFSKVMTLLGKPSIPTENSPHYQTFQTQLSQSGRTIEALLEDSLKPENEAGAGKGATFFNFTDPAFSHYGIKILDEEIPFFRNVVEKTMFQLKNQKSWSEAMVGDIVGSMFGGPSAEKRLEKVLPKLSEGIQLEALPTKIGDLSTHSHDAILVKSKEGKVLGIIQPKIIGKTLDKAVPCKNDMGSLIRYTDESIQAFLTTIKPEELTLLYNSPAIQKVLANTEPTSAEWNTFSEEIVPKLPNDFKELIADRSYQSDPNIKIAEFMIRYDAFQKEYVAYTKALASYPKETINQFVANGEKLKNRKVQIDVDRHSNNILHNFPTEANPQGAIGMVDLDEFNTKLDIHHAYNHHQMLLALLGRYNTSDYHLPEFVLSPQHKAAVQQNLATFINHYKEALVENNVSLTPTQLDKDLQQSLARICQLANVSLQNGE